MMQDCYGRDIDYLRISVTDRCNCRCIYCMPPEGICLKKHEDILSYEEIRDIAAYGASKGIRKIKITGGEPLAREGIAKLVAMLAEIPGIEDLGMTTNGILLPKYAAELKAAGLQRVNISLDSLDPVRYREITRGANLDDAIKGIDTAIENQLSPVKLNMVIIPGINEDEKTAMKVYAGSRGLEARFITMMDLAQGKWTPVEGGVGGVCEQCNRLRLSADGFLRPCLFSDIEYNVRELGVEKAYEMALSGKPLHGTRASGHGMRNIGG